MRLSYVELWQQVGSVANTLLAGGLEPDDRVAVYLEYRAETVAAVSKAIAATAIERPKRREQG